MAIIGNTEPSEFWSAVFYFMGILFILGVVYYSFCKELPE